MSSSTPRSRSENIIVQEIGDETLVYDVSSREAHCLNRTAAMVWRACDGTRTKRELSFF